MAKLCLLVDHRRVTNNNNQSNLSRAAIMMFPPPDNEKGPRFAATSDEKLETLDRVIPKIISARVIVENQMINSTLQRGIEEGIREAVEALVNHDVLEVIFSANPLAGHQLQTPKSWQVVVRKHNDIGSSLKDLIRFAYEDEISPRVVRQKVIGCINVILHNVNSAEFVDMAEAADNRGGRFWRKVRARKRLKKRLSKRTWIW